MLSGCRSTAGGWLGSVHPVSLAVMNEAHGRMAGVEQALPPVRLRLRLSAGGERKRLPVLPAQQLQVPGLGLIVQRRHAREDFSKHAPAHPRSGGTRKSGVSFGPAGGSSGCSGFGRLVGFGPDGVSTGLPGLSLSSILSLPVRYGHVADTL